MDTDRKKEYIEQYIRTLAENLNNNYSGIVDDNKLSRAISMFTTSDYLNRLNGNSQEELIDSFNKTIKPEIDKIVDNMIENYMKMIQKVKDHMKEVERHYNLNDFFDCRLSNETLHLHVVPKDISEDIKKVGIREYFKYISAKLDDALSKIPEILKDPNNSDIKTVFAVSPLLKVSAAQEIFKEHGFNVQMSTNPIFLKMFDNKRIGEASISKDDFMRLYDRVDSQDMMIENIEKNMHSEFFIEMLKRTYEHTHSIGVVGDMIGELYTHHIINKDGYGFEEYMTKMESLYAKLGNKEISQEEFDKEKAVAISTVIAKRLGIDTNKGITIEDQNQIKQYFLSEYVTNGYVSHAFPEAYKQSIMEKGLVASTESRGESNTEVDEIQTMFMDKGIVAPLGGYPFYSGSGIYFEHDFTKTFQHAIYSPEWFNWFTSASHTQGFPGIEKSPFIMRNEEACRKNIEDLCKNAALSQEESQKVISFYEKNYEKLKSPELNVALISRKVVEKDKITAAVSEDMGLTETINSVLHDEKKQFREHIGNVSTTDIKPEDLHITHIPEVNKYLHVDSYARESRESLTDTKANLAIIERVDSVNEKLNPALKEKVTQVKEQLKSEKKTNVNSENKNASDKPFKWENPQEKQTYEKIKEKNQSIHNHAKQEQQAKQNEKPMVRKREMPKPGASQNNSSKGISYNSGLIILIGACLLVLIVTIIFLLLRGIS